MDADMTDREASELLAALGECFDDYGPLPDAIPMFKAAILSSDWLRDTLAAERRAVVEECAGIVAGFGLAEAVQAIRNLNPEASDDRG